MQVKRSEGGNRVSAFSRNGNDNSLLYARLLEGIMQKLDATVSGAMLDGECVVWDRETKKAESYDENVNMSWIESTLGLPRIDHDWFTEKDQRKRRRAVNHMYKRYGMQWGEKKAAKSVGSDNEDSDEEAARKAKSRLRPPPKDGRSTGSWHVSTARYRLKFIAFDLFWIDGLSQKIVDACALRVPGLYGVSLRPDLDLKHRGCIMHWPLALRREILRVIIQPDVHRFELIDHKIVKSLDCEERKDQINEYFDEVVAKNEEGLVLKRSDSQYLLGEKSKQKNAAGEGAAWLKIKPEYNDCTPEIDLLIVAGWAILGKEKIIRAKGLLAFFWRAVTISFRARPRISSSGIHGSSLLVRWPLLPGLSSVSSANILKIIPRFSQREIISGRFPGGLWIGNTKQSLAWSARTSPTSRLTQGVLSLSRSNSRRLSTTVSIRG